MYGLVGAFIVACLAFFGFIDSYAIYLCFAAYALGALIAPKEKEVIIVMSMEDKLENIFTEMINGLNNLGSNVKMEREFSKKLSEFKENSFDLIHYLKKSKTHDINHENFFNFRKMISDYVPNLIHSFENIPQEFWMYKKDGKTFIEKVNEQMSMINQGLKDISIAYYDKSMKAVDIQNALVKDKFEKGFEIDTIQE